MRIGGVMMMLLLLLLLLVVAAEASMICSRNMCAGHIPLLPGKMMVLRLLVGGRDWSPGTVGLLHNVGWLATIQVVLTRGT